MEKFKCLKKSFLSKLPKTTGVYLFSSKGGPASGGKKGAKFLYIGKASNIRERVKNHFQQPTYKDNFFINQVINVGYIKTDSEIEALLLEAKLIKKKSWPKKPLKSYITPNRQQRFVWKFSIW